MGGRSDRCRILEPATPGFGSPWNFTMDVPACLSISKAACTWYMQLTICCVVRDDVIARSESLMGGLGT